MPIRKTMKHSARKYREKRLSGSCREPEKQEEKAEEDTSLFQNLPPEQLLCDDNLRAIGESAAAIIHELKGPMQAISAQMQVMQTLLHKDGVTRHDQRFSLIYSEIERLSALVMQYLRLGKPREGPEKLPGNILHLPTLAQETAQLLRSLCLKQGATLSVDEDEDFPMVTGDEMSVRRILVNLIINAAQAQVEPGRHIRVSFREEEATLSLTVENDGPPIVCQPLDKVFQPRYTTKKNGTGLGIYASRMLAREQGGDLTAYSRPGRTAFTLTLPRFPQALRCELTEPEVAVLRNIS